MSSNGSVINKLTTRQPTAVERLNLMEQQIQQLDQNDQNIARELNNLDGVVEALVELYGAQPIGEKMLEIKHRKMEDKADAHQAAFDKAVEEGKLAKVESSQKTEIVIVSQQKDAEGQVLYPTRVFLPVAAYTAEAQKLLGFEGGKLTRELKVGETMELAGVKEGDPARGSMTILALYEPVVKAKTEPSAVPEESETQADTSDAPALPTEQA